MKKCTDCGLTKELHEFNKAGKWHRNRCKKCHNAKYYIPTGKPNSGRFQKGHKPLNPFKKGNIPWSKGKPATREMRDRLRKMQLGRKHSAEEIEKRRQSNILARQKDRKGGRRCVKTKEWSLAVRQRDGNKCQKCGSTNRLHAHHIIPWRINEMLRHELSNGITYCSSCHSKEECKITPRKGWNKGKNLTDEHRKKISDAHKGKIPWNKGLKKELS